MLLGKVTLSKSYFFRLSFLKLMFLKASSAICVNFIPLCSLGIFKFLFFLTFNSPLLENPSITFLLILKSAFSQIL